MEPITTGVSITAFRRAQEVLVCLGNSLDWPALGPFLAHHAPAAGTRYRVSRLNSREAAWREIGTFGGDELQRVTIQLEALGYALYAFDAT